MESEEKAVKKSHDNAKLSEIKSDTDEDYTHSEQYFVNLIAKILVNISMKQYHDRKKGN